MGSSTPSAVLITGASGYIGRLVAAVLLREEDCALLLPLRPHHKSEDVQASIAAELECAGVPFDRGHAERLHFLPVALTDSLEDLGAQVAALGVTQVVHCAACLDYFNTEELERINVGLTQALLERSKTWGIERFIYISTAFSSGYVDGEVGEVLHPEPENDPTEYTRTKRQAEKSVADSGVPYLCLRPSIVIGDSFSGHYAGNQYGLYQLWAGVEKLLCTRWEPEYHVVASDEPTHLLHQDAFQAAFLAAFRSDEGSGFVNFVSPPELVPSGKDLWRMWLDGILRAERVHFYDKVEHLPIGSMCRRQRALMALASVNVEIAAHPWRFETTNLQRLVARTPGFAYTTIDSVKRCLDAYVQQSDRVQAFLRSYGSAPSVRQQLEEVGS